jgi:hypothetical protein
MSDFDSLCILLMGRFHIVQVIDSLAPRHEFVTKCAYARRATCSGRYGLEDILSERARDWHALTPVKLDQCPAF